MLRVAGIALAFLSAVLLFSVTPVEAQERKGDKPAATAEKGTRPEAQPNDGTRPPGFTGEVYEQSFKVIFALFIIATILESGLAVIFNWRPFIQLFDSRGVKTLVSIAFAYVFVETFDFDAITSLVNLYQPAAYKVGPAGKFITALVIAGGSAGVNKLLVALGFRSVKTAEQATPKPPKTEAWISVRLLRKDAVGPVAVLIGPDGAQTPVAGTISGSSSEWGLMRFFLRDYGRFPTAGGYAITPDPAKLYKVYVAGRDKDGNLLSSSVAWGPNALAPSAIVDIELTL
jgi:hypothetical protein